MFDFYFTYWSELPPGSGYPLFGKVHFLWLACIAAGIILCAVFYRKLRPDAQKRFLKTLAIIMLAMEAWREIVLTATGHIEFQALPLHLCGLAIFLEALFAFFPNAFFGELACVVCLPGAASALIYPDWLRYPTINYMNLHGFILHGILVMFPILVLTSGRYLPSIRRIYMPILFLVVSALILYRINIWQDCNFMFLNHPSNGSPFEALYASHGYGSYLVAFVCTVIAVILAMYGLIALITFLCRRGHPPDKKKSPDRIK